MRKYSRKTQIQWDLISLKSAMNAVLSKKMGYKKASELFHVPKTTLIRYIKKFKMANETPPVTTEYLQKIQAGFKPNPHAFETQLTHDPFIQHNFMSQPTTAELQKEVQRQLENEFYEERRQMATSRQSNLATGQPSSNDVQMQLHLTANSLLVTRAQPVPRQVHMLEPPKPVEKPKPRKKRIFLIADHQRSVMYNLTSLWKSGKLCDAGLGNGSFTVKVHKVVLSAVCPKLLSVFSADFFSQKFLQVNFPCEVSKEALKAFAEYMYKGVLDLDCDILEQLKIIAKRLDMKEFEELCDSHLSKYMHEHISATANEASFTNIPLHQVNMQMNSSQSPFSSVVATSTSSATSINPPAINIKQEIPEEELLQIKEDTATIFGHGLELASQTPNKTEISASTIISPDIKTEKVGPDDDEYGHWGGRSSKQVFRSTAPSTPSSSSIVTASVPASSNKSEIPFSESTNVQFKSAPKAHHSNEEASLKSILHPVSETFETADPQSDQMKDDIQEPSVSTLIIDDSSSIKNEVFPIRLFTAGGDSLPLLTTPTVDINTIEFNETNLT